METDNSSESSSEYEIITENIADKHKNKSPTLNIANNGNYCDLKNVISEVLKEEHQLNTMEKENTNANVLTNIVDKKTNHKSMTLPLASSSSSFQTQTLDRSPVLKDYLTPKSEFSTPSEINRVGHSVFYDSPAEKQDDMKPEKSDSEEEVSDIDQGCTIFSGVTYLGSANINKPKSADDIQMTMMELNNGTTSAGLKVSVSIPTSPDGFVVLYDADADTVVANYEVQRIIFYVHGQEDSNEQACFGFTWSHGESQETAIYQCHIFRCNIPEAVKQVSCCFQKAFNRYPPSLTCSSITSSVNGGGGLACGISAIDSSLITSDVSGNPLNSAEYEFIVSLEIKERVGSSSGTYSTVPRDKLCFKIRSNIDKEVSITVKQSPTANLQPLYIERCFGILLSPGKLVRQADMQLLDLRSTGYQNNHISQNGTTSAYQIRAGWDSAAFEQLNVECQKMFITIAVDLVIKGIQEPVRFVLESPVTILSQNETRIIDHFILKRPHPMSVRFYLQLKKTENSWEVSSIDPSEEIIDANATPSSLLKIGINNFSKMVRSSSTISFEDDNCPTDYSSDGDEPLLSGTGEVSKDCSQDTLDEWDPILKEWEGEKRPKNLSALVRLGVPEALRGKVWQKLSNVEGKIEMSDRYRTLITKETKCEAVIQRDIHRTFPANKFFKETGGSGQDALFKVSKAYAVYDSEVNYCQGLSFIAASLLLHMPEEDAYCVLVSLMYDYGLRDLYKDGFEILHMRLFQLNRAMRDHLPKLFEHFERNGIESHMFASQWFLTLFTARFPLCFVFHVLDVFLLDGIPILFQVAITLLTICESELRNLDFEGILKYFRVSLPKKCRSSSKAMKIMKKACELKIKKLKQYEEEFYANKRNDERLQKEAQIYAEKFKEKYQGQIISLEQRLEDSNKKSANFEQKLKDAYEKALQVDKTHGTIINDYKQILQRQEQQMTKLNDMLEEITKTVAKCKTCSSSIQNDSGTQLGPLDPLMNAIQRIRELESELAQSKLAQVEAECKNQDLNHQLNTTLTEIQSNRNSWQPWLSKTFNTIQEKVSTSRQRGDSMPSFQSYTSSSLEPQTNTTSSISGNQEKSSSVEHSPSKMHNKYSNILTRKSLDVLPKDKKEFLHNNITFGSSNNK